MQAGDAVVATVPGGAQVRAVVTMVSPDGNALMLTFRGFAHVVQVGDAVYVGKLALTREGGVWRDASGQVVEVTRDA